MTAFNYARIGDISDRIIRRFGMRGLLRRSDGDRSCYLLRLDYAPNERSDVILSTDWMALVAPRSVEAEIPDNERDKLVILSKTGVEIETLKIITEPGRLQPAHDVIYWELQVRPG